jgi:hypothetical protein
VKSFGGNSETLSIFTRLPQDLLHLHNQVDLTASSLADMCVIQTRHDQQKKKVERRDLLDLAPAAIVKFNAKGRDATKLNKNEIVALLLNCYCVDTVVALKKKKKASSLRSYRTRSARTEH